jgi:fatty acid desaturase
MQTNETNEKVPFEGLLSASEKAELRQKVRELSKVNPWLGLGYIALDWMVIVAIVVLAEHFFSPLIYVLAVFLIATRQHALAVMSHEGAHYRLVQDHRWNTWLANLLCVYPLFIQIEIYRYNHLLHHKYTNEEKDPDVRYQKDLPDYQFPMAGKKLLRIFIFEFLGGGMIANFQRMRRYNSDPELKNALATELAQAKGVRIAYYLILAIALTVLGGWKLYFLYWLVPILWFLPMILRLRNICEHFGLSHDSDLQGTRDVACSWLEGWLLSPHYIRLHLVHHFYPSIPFYNLPKLRRYLLTLSPYRNDGHCNSSYVLPWGNPVWRELVTK